MSCGNRFQCGITRFQKHSFTPDKPSNVELHNENQKRLNDLLKAREDIDKQFLSATPNKTADMNTVTLLTSQNALKTDTDTYTPWTSDNTADNNFTPWKIPSTTDFKVTPK